MCEKAKVIFVPVQTFKFHVSATQNFTKQAPEAVSSQIETGFDRNVAESFQNDLWCRNFFRAVIFN